MFSRETWQSLKENSWEVLSGNLTRMQLARGQAHTHLFFLASAVELLASVQCPQLTLEWSLLTQVQLDHVSASPPFCQNRLLLLFAPWGVLPKINRKFDIIIRSPLGSHWKVIYVPKLYSWFSKPDKSFTSKWRVMFLTEGALKSLAKNTDPSSCSWSVVLLPG